MTRIAHESALQIAVRFRVSAYDARFLALAEQLGSRLVTEDAKLRAGAPALTQSLNEALAAAELHSVKKAADHEFLLRAEAPERLWHS